MDYKEKQHYITTLNSAREGSNNDRASCLPVIVALAIFWGFVGLLIYFGI